MSVVDVIFCSILYFSLSHVQNNNQKLQYLNKL